VFLLIIIGYAAYPQSLYVRVVCVTYAQSAKTMTQPPRKRRRTDPEIRRSARLAAQDRTLYAESQSTDHSVDILTGAQERQLSADHTLSGWMSDDEHSQNLHGNYQPDADEDDEKKMNEQIPWTNSTKCIATERTAALLIVLQVLQMLITVPKSPLSGVLQTLKIHADTLSETDPDEQNDLFRKDRFVMMSLVDFFCKLETESPEQNDPLTCDIVFDAIRDRVRLPYDVGCIMTMITEFLRENQTTSLLTDEQKTAYQNSISKHFSFECQIEADCTCEGGKFSVSTTLPASLVYVYICICII